MHIIYISNQFFSPYVGPVNVLGCVDNTRCPAIWIATNYFDFSAIDVVFLRRDSNPGLWVNIYLNLTHALNRLATMAGELVSLIRVTCLWHRLLIKIHNIGRIHISIFEGALRCPIKFAFERLLTDGVK